MGPSTTTLESAVSVKRSTGGLSWPPGGLFCYWVAFSVPFKHLPSLNSVVQVRFSYT